MIIDGADLVGSVIGSTLVVVVEAGGGELENTGVTLLVYQPRSDIFVVEGVDPPLNIRVIMYMIPPRSRNHNNISIIIMTRGALRFPYIAVYASWEILYLSRSCSTITSPSGRGI